MNIKTRKEQLSPQRLTAWNQLRRARAVALVAMGLLAVPIVASSAAVTVDFEGVGNNGAVGNFYDGDGGAALDFGIVFSSNALGLVDTDAGGTGSFENEPSPSTIMYFLQDSSVTVDYSPGFTSAFSFYYTALNAGSVSVYDGLGGTGTLLGSQTLTAQDQSGCAASTAVCSWSLISVLFSGTAKSVVLGGTAALIGFDDLTFGATPVPLPAAAWLLLSGLAGLGFFGRRRAAR